MKEVMKLVLIDDQGNPVKTITVSGEGDDLEERLARINKKIKENQIAKGWTEADLQSFARKMKQ